MANNKFQRLNNPPPPLFFNKKEHDLVKQVTTEIAERVLSQQVLYFPIDIERSNFHSMYGESIEKTFLPPILVKCFVEWEGNETNSINGVIDRRSSLLVHFARRRLQEDQNLFVQEGDFIKYGEEFYEIAELNRPRLVFGQIDQKLEVIARCVRARGDTFNAI